MNGFRGSKKGHIQDRGRQENQIPKEILDFIKTGRYDNIDVLNRFVREWAKDVKISQIRGFYSKVLKARKSINSDEDNTDRELLKLYATSNYQSGRIVPRFYQTVNNLLKVVMKEGNKKDAFENFFLLLQLAVSNSKGG